MGTKNYPYAHATRDDDGDWDSSGSGYGLQPYGGLITPKEVWAGSSPEHAFSEDASWSYKRQAQIKFYDMLRRNRKALLKCTGGEPGRGDEWKVEPQISAFYTSFPWPARASAGHTIFLEAANVKEQITSVVLNFLRDAQRAREHGIDERAHEKTAYLVAQSLGNRALFDMLCQVPELDNVEFYRLFQAAANTLKFRRLSDIIDGVVLMGDLLPEPRLLDLHDMTRQIMDSLMNASRGFWSAAAAAFSDTTSDLYLQWGVALMDRLVRFLPPVEAPAPAPGQALPVGATPDNAGAGGTGTGQDYRYSADSKKSGRSPDHIDALKKPQPPLLDSGRTTLEEQLERLINRMREDAGAPGTSNTDTAQPGDAEINHTKEVINGLMKAAAEATSQQTGWEDMREDLVEGHLSGSPFQAGPIAGEATSGTSITRTLNGKEVGGELFDRNVPLCEDVEKIRDMHRMAEPVTKVLKHNLYPSIREEFRMEYPCSSGQMDSRRLPLADVSEAVYRRFQAKQVMDPSGRALLLIAADASASLSDPQMRMCKCLMTAWLDSVPSSQMQVLAAFYHSGGVRNHLNGPLVQWVYHPRKTPVYAPRDAVRAVASLPDSGSGAQSDALSLTYLLDEAKALSKGVCVYLTLISDCAFNKSFQGSEAKPAEEVAEVLRQGREDLDQNLHVTLVALDKNVPDAVKQAVDAVIPVDEAALAQPAKVAETVGAYVAACIRKRRKQINKNS